MSSKFPYSRSQFESWLKTKHPRSKVSENHEYVLARWFRSMGRNAVVNARGEVTVDGVKVNTPGWAVKFTTKTRTAQKTRSAMSALSVLASC